MTRSSSEPAAANRPRSVLLLVDDERSFLVAFERLLARKGFQVVSVVNAELAIRALERWPVYAVVADMRMPDMDGLELLDIVRERWPYCLRVLLTGDPFAVEDVCRRRGHIVIDKGNTIGGLLQLLRGNGHE